MTGPDLSRRRLLGLMATSASLSLLPIRTSRAKTSTPAENTVDSMPTVGIALGAGGANGLAHILMLEVLDELGITPHRISGSSIGAIIGALYAAGMTAGKIHELVEKFIISSDEPLAEQLTRKEPLRWFEFIEIEFGHGGLLSSEGFITYLYDTIEYDAFEQLQIPLRIVAADLWRREQVVLESGKLLPAVKASMAIPGIFQPVKIEDRILIDGGVVNPVPYDLLLEECDIVIGIDVIGVRSNESAMPGYFNAVFNSVKVMQKAIMSAKLQHKRPAIYIVPEIVDIRALEFYRAKEVFEQSRPAQDRLRKQLKQVISDYQQRTTGWYGES